MHLHTSDSHTTHIEQFYDFDWGANNAQKHQAGSINVWTNYNNNEGKRHKRSQNKQKRQMKKKNKFTKTRESTNYNSFLFIYFLWFISSFHIASKLHSKATFLHSASVYVSHKSLWNVELKSSDNKKNRKEWNLNEIKKNIADKPRIIYNVTHYSKRVWEWKKVHARANDDGQLHNSLPLQSAQQSLNCEHAKFKS